MVTLGLSLLSFAIGIGIMMVDKENGVFWTIIFGWSGIAATFCPTVILSLCWTKFTALGAKCAMVAGFFSVSLFKWVVPLLLARAGKGTWASYLEDLDVLLPSFAVGFIVAVLVSLFDKKGQARSEGVAQELRG